MKKNKGNFEQNIFLSFFFHIDLYHNVKQNNEDKNLLNKKCELIKYIIDSFDKLNEKGIRAKAVWKVDNLSKEINNLYPDVLFSLKKRVEKFDEIALTPYLDALISSLNEEELDYVIFNALSNSDNSGLFDIFNKKISLFSSSFYTGGVEKSLKKIGIDKILLPLKNIEPCLDLPNQKMNFENKYYPFILKTSFDETINVIPTFPFFKINSLKNFIKILRFKQISLNENKDLFLVIDFDLNDPYLSKILNERFIDEKKSLFNIIYSLSELDYCRFVTPSEFLFNHVINKEFELNYDVSPSLNSYSSFSEKKENIELWSLIEEGRKKMHFAKTINKEFALGINIKKYEEDSLKYRILALSSSSFGPSNPVLNKERAKISYDLASSSLDYASLALENVIRFSPKNRFYKNYMYKENGDTLLSLEENDDIENSVKDGYERLFVFKRNTRLDNHPVTNENVIFFDVDRKFIANDECAVEVKGDKIQFKVGKSFYQIRSCIKYEGVTYENSIDTVLAYTSENIQELEIHTRLFFKEYEAAFGYVFKIIKGKPYVYVDVIALYPSTKKDSYDEKKSRELLQTYDDRWEEIAPFEIIPLTNSKSPFKITKHNFLGKEKTFILNDLEKKKIRKIDSLNKIITCGYLGVSQDDKGLIISQNTTKESSFAFCPLRCKKEKGIKRIYLNPFGSYEIKNKKISNFFAKKEKYISFAPSFNGQEQLFSLCLGSYEKEINEELKDDALSFAYPPMYVKEGEKNGRE